MASKLAKAEATYADGVKQFARPDDPQPSPALAPLVGNFANPAFGKAVGMRSNGQLPHRVRLCLGRLLKELRWSGARTTDAQALTQTAGGAN
jgi:hypothetical protein